MVNFFQDVIVDSLIVYDFFEHIIIVIGIELSVVRPGQVLAHTSKIVGCRNFLSLYVQLVSQTHSI